MGNAATKAVVVTAAKRNTSTAIVEADRIYRSFYYALLFIRVELIPLQIGINYPLGEAADRSE